VCMCVLCARVCAWLCKLDGTSQFVSCTLRKRGESIGVIGRVQERHVISRYAPPREI
jgi:hypothetical protein